jgi:putative transcription factor
LKKSGGGLGTKKSLGGGSKGLSAARAAGASVSTEARSGAARSHSSHLAKLEDSDDVYKHATVDKTVSKAICQARMAKKMTQAQLAQAINERPQTIQELENGKAIPNAQVLNKLDRALGIHLPRNKK